MGNESNKGGTGKMPKGSDPLQTLHELVNTWLRQNNQKQSALASDCGVDAADLAHFFSGKRTLPPYALANLAKKLDLDVAHVLTVAEYSQCQRKVEENIAAEQGSTTPIKSQGWELARDTYAKLLRRFASNEPPRASARHPGTLADWPMAFLPMVVFVGDRRETPPKSPADLLAASASMGDLYYLPSLSLPAETEIRSDKSCVITSPESMRALVQDKNLLVIGSPAANLMAREVNGGACFSFHVTSEALGWASEFQKLLETIRYLPGELERYMGVNSATSMQAEWSRRRQYMIFGFARSGILDPVDFRGLRATATGADSDYGVVSLCRHPWSDQHVAIMAAGLHGPATAAAVKLLSEENSFDHRPFGGVFRVHVPIEAPWEQRYHHLNPVWDTHEYTASKYEAAVTEFAGKHQAELKSGQFKFWQPEHVTALLRLVSSHGRVSS